MEPQVQARACTPKCVSARRRGPQLLYPTAPMGAETIRGAITKASAGYPPVAESAVALAQGHSND